MPAIPNILHLLMLPLVWGTTTLGLLLTAAGTWYFVRRRGHPPVATALAVFTAAAIAVITLTPAGWWELGNPAVRCRTDVLRAVGRLVAGPQAVANIAMFLPLGFFAVLAGARPRHTAAVMLILPGVLELLQALAANRVCTVQDWLDNSIGGLLGVAAGAALLAFRRRSAATLRSGPPAPGR